MHPTSLRLLPLPSLLHATLIANAMTRAALALLVARHPHCHHHHPCHSCPIRPCHRHHPPHTLVICHRWLLWLCGHQHSLACHYPLLTISLLVDCFHYPNLPISRIHQQMRGWGHIRELVKSPLSLAGQCVHGKPTCGDLMIGKARIRTSYHSSGGILIASHPSAIAMLGNSWLLGPLISRSSSTTTSS